MALSSPDKSKLKAQLRECFGKVVYTHKTHEKCADYLIALSKWIKFALIFLSAITTVGLLYAIFGELRWVKIICTGISFIMLALTLYTKEFNLDEKAEKHKIAALKLWNIRELYSSLLTDLDNLTLDEIVSRRDELQQTTLEIYEQSPRTDSKGYLKARKALKEDEELYFSEEELDELLPHYLRETKQ
ncbi:hypothetical protein HNP86_000969 [Methanococcus maripaludis]|uniref:SMODS and SLOG-associating 2TM effector domain-containing protein n=1 Tax=Methanococcus maripaludis TaxID=39152 RepID=A0A7J9NT43_METMI|nr:SLATT domain-containing protein [Methanococcus maripaludis]MBA2850838.1 hypothetical protein [Methanococcus maripaludis]